MYDKQKVLNEILNLNNGNYPFSVNVEGDTIIAKWKWMDTTYFGVGVVTESIKNFTYTVVLNNDNTYSERDNSEENTKKVDLAQQSFGMQKDLFVGKTTNKEIQFGFGTNNNTGETGVVVNKFDTKIIKEPIRTILENNGLRNAGILNFATTESQNSTVQPNVNMNTNVTSDVQTNMPINNNANTVPVNQTKKSNKKLLLIGLVIFIVAIFGIIMFVSSNSNKLICKSSKGKLTIMYDEERVTGYTTAGFEFDMDYSNDLIEEIGLDEFLTSFEEMFEQKYDGTCEIKEK